MRPGPAATAIIAAVTTAVLAAVPAVTAQAATRQAGDPAAAAARQPERAAADSAKRSTSPHTAPAAAPSAPRVEPHVRQLCPSPRAGNKLTCTASVRTNVAGRLGVQAGDTPAGYGPADLQSAYQLPQSPSSTATVALVAAFDDPNAETDMGTYRTQFGLPACTSASGCFTKVDENGGSTYPYANSYWAAEISVDLDMLSAVCPDCHIILVEASDTLITDIGTAVNTAVSLGATSIVEGAAGYEEPDETTLDPQYFTHPGVTITAPTGDFGYSGGTAVPYPGVSPGVLAVGGTTLTRDPDSPRGWDETAWADASSGCSAYEPKPAYQHDTGCANTTAADVAAVADPATGVAAYDSYQSGGWSVMGGTGAAASIVAGIAALAGQNGPAKSFPYASPDTLFDITSGSNGYCDGSYLCTAGPGYDGPTGMGSPHGILAFAPPSQHGDVTGTVTDAATGDPLAGASVSADGTTAYTDSSGHYTLPLTVGSHDVTATAFGHDSLTAAGLAVTGQGSTAHNFALTAQPTVTLSGTVTDGSGHGWPVYAKITVRGMPGGVLYTDPATGKYSVTVPQGQAETLEISPAYPGYQPVVETAQVGSQDTVASYQLSVDSSTCTAPGYAYQYQGLFEPFDGTSAPSGWTVTDDNGSGYTWAFNDPGNRGNRTGGSGGFAIVDGEYDGEQNVKDTELISPPVDLSQVSSPTIGFSTDLPNLGTDVTADVDLSLDGGTTWQNVWQETGNLPGPQVVTIPVPQAAGQPSVEVRFHYTGQWDQWWEVDNAWVGVRTCSPQPGGLVIGQVTDRNNGNGLVEATVSGAGAGTATTNATPDDPTRSEEYWLFQPSGAQQLTATSGRYQPQTATVNVKANAATKADFSLAAGRLKLSATSVPSTQVLGTSATKKLTITNTGTAPATVALVEQTTGDTAGAPAAKASSRAKAGAGGAAAPAIRIPGSYSPLRTGARSTAASRTAAAPAAASASAAWQVINHYPVQVMDNSAAYGDGTIYSVGGLSASDQVIADSYAYDPATQGWSTIAAMPQPRQKPSVAYINGELIVTGGWNQTGATIPQTDVYDPATNSWTAGRDVPAAYAGAGTAVLNGKMYVIGGCTVDCGSQDVYVYDPATDQWASAAPYPMPVAWEACGGLDGKVYCTGGISDISSYTSTYAYDPGANTWSQVASLPIDLWGASYAAAGGQLIVTGGITEDGQLLTNQSYAYDPAANTWTALANDIYPLYRGGAACGFYQIGGSAGGFAPEDNAEQLPGYGQCGGAVNLDWVAAKPAQTTLQPGASVTVTVSFNAAAPDITQPGAETGALAVRDDTPYDVPSVGLTMNVTPPRGWGQVSGTITGVNCDGSTAPLAGAAVQIGSSSGSQVSVIADAAGHYGYWLNKSSNPLTLIVTDSTWQPQTKKVRISAGKTITENFALQPIGTCH